MFFFGFWQKLASVMAHEARSSPEIISNWSLAMRLHILMVFGFAQVLPSVGDKCVIKRCVNPNFFFFFPLLCHFGQPIHLRWMRNFDASSVCLWEWDKMQNEGIGARSRGTSACVVVSFFPLLFYFDLLLAFTYATTLLRILIYSAPTIRRTITFFFKEEDLPLKRTLRI